MHTFEELIAVAELIVLGRCQRSASVWRGHSLVSRYTFSVDEPLKGERAGEVTVTVPGGVDLSRAAPAAMSMPHAPSFLPGDCAVLLLERVDAREFGVVGLSQGCFAVRNGQVYELRRRGLTRQRSQSLAQFRRQIAEALRAASERNTV